METYDAQAICRQPFPRAVLPWGDVMNRRDLLTGAALLAGVGPANAFGIGRLGAGMGHLGGLGKLNTHAPSVLTTWNPADTASSITLSNGNLTAAQPSVATTWNIVRGIANHTTGKFYFESHIDVAISNGELGVADGAEFLNNNFLGSSSGNSIGWDYVAGSVYVGGSVVTIERQLRWPVSDN
jgi:hypothetical protein